MKLEVGHYFRTNDGRIYKNYGIGTNFFGDTVIYVSEENNLYDSVINVIIIKSSFNIIDLIEIGDFVNGDKIYKVGELDYNNEKCAVVDLGTDARYLYYSEKDIQEILTKEQYEANVYRVKESE